MAILELTNISKSFQDGDQSKVILDQVNLSVSEGEFVAVLGPSGSGKSTLLTIAGLLLSSDSGQLHIAGQELTQLKQSEWTKKRRELIGFIFQNHQLLPYLTISEQLQLVANLSSDRTKEESRQEMDELLDQLGILESKNKYPSQLSGGQKQRVAIARAFISHPQLILADEPTASLDEDRGREIAALIQKEVKEQNKAAVMVTHDQRILEFVDTVYELKHGKLYKIFL